MCCSDRAPTVEWIQEAKNILFPQGFIPRPQPTACINLYVQAIKTNISRKPVPCPAWPLKAIIFLSMQSDMRNA